MQMPFGLHKGKEVAELPLAYLQWLVNYTDLYGELKAEVCRLLDLEPDYLTAIKAERDHYRSECDNWQKQYAELASRYMSLQKQLTYTDALSFSENAIFGNRDK